MPRTVWIIRHHVNGEVASIAGCFSSRRSAKKKLWNIIKANNLLNESSKFNNRYGKACTMVYDMAHHDGWERIVKDQQQHFVIEDWPIR